MRKLFAGLVAAVLTVAVSYGVTVTNQGQVITISTLDEAMDASTVYGVDQSTYATPVKRQGIIVASWRMPAGDDTGAAGANKFGPVVPKGAVILDHGFIEIGVPLTPLSGTTNSIVLSGSTVLTNGVSLKNAAGLAVAVDSPFVVSTNDQLSLVAEGAITQGQFTVYLPYVLGNSE